MNPLAKRLLALGASGALAISSAYLIIPFEGEVVNKRGSHVVYKDIVGVSTACWGQTGLDLDGKKPVAGTTYTQEYCEKWYVEELTKYNKAMLKYVKVELKPYEEVAYTSFIWNLGETNFKNSTLLKKLNAGDRAGACEQLLSWNKVTVLPAGVPAYRARGETCTVWKDGKYSCTVKGLTNRRKFEYEVCMGNNTEVNKALEAVKQP